jgi:hypothetical protein
VAIPCSHEDLRAGVELKLSSVYAAIEDAEAAIAEADEPDAIESAGQDARRRLFNTEAEERADTLDSSADELESWSHTQDQEPETCEEHSGDDEDDCEECQELRVQRPAR